MVSQDLSHRVRAHQKVNHTYIRRVCVHTQDTHGERNGLEKKEEKKSKGGLGG